MERQTKSEALPRNSIWRQLQHNKQVPRERSCGEPAQSALGLLALVASVTCTRSTHVYRAPTVSQARRQGDHSGGPQDRVSGFPPQPAGGEEGCPHVPCREKLRVSLTLQSQSLSPATRGQSTTTEFEEGAGQPSGSHDQNPEDPAPPLTPAPNPAQKRNSPEATDAVTTGKP